MPSPADAAPSYLVAAELAGPGHDISLDGAEWRYLLRVCRAREGDTATVTDGRGGRARIRLRRAGADPAAVVEALEQVARARPVWMACGAPEGQRADWLVEKLAELGVARLLRLNCQRAEWHSGREARWERLADAAMRQSRQCHRIEISQPLSIGEFLAECPGEMVCTIATEGTSEAAGESAGRPETADGLPRIGVTGPAPGFSDDELKRFDRAGCRAKSLGGTVLRAETAAVVLAALLGRGGASGRS